VSQHERAINTLELWARPTFKFEGRSAELQLPPKGGVSRTPLPAVGEIRGTERQLGDKLAAAGIRELLSDLAQ
jgi:hypothetical protein